MAFGLVPPRACPGIAHQAHFNGRDVHEQQSSRSTPKTSSIGARWHMMCRPLSESWMDASGNDSWSVCMGALADGPSQCGALSSAARGAQLGQPVSEQDAVNGTYWVHSVCFCVGVWWLVMAVWVESTALKGTGIGVMCKSGLIQHVWNGALCCVP
ncbi:hypothetical protein K488DRAFT_75344 [Vararia minispora EC-137]|uniref:Uncharacterized protein n=1 Tax=Vararia minispora EC-137 TaxID=1314806 RepID=A0ACB8Q440_9AGAM|nr:hypothetical protein K488DRAFT_75344 [Vararia minispora EC-137]